MRYSAKRIRAGVIVLYFINCFALLSYYTHDSPFCSRPDGSSHAIQTLRLTVACTAWELFATSCGAFAAKKLSWRELAPLVATLIALGLASLPFWMYDSGRFIFDRTWADVSCYFTEGYAFGFAFLVAPVLALATLAGELLILKAGG